MERDNRHLVLCAAALLAAGCASYSVPGRPADLTLLDRAQEARDQAADERSSSGLSLSEILERRPAIAFPASIAVVRIQASERPSWGELPRYGAAGFEVVTRRDVESAESLRLLRDLPRVTSVAGVNRLLVPRQIDSEVDLRKVAAELHADVLLIYTFDTSEELDYEHPLFSALSLGFLPLHELEVRTTASAILLDTRTGYCYGLAEGSAFRSPHSSFWTYQESMDDTREETEREAFASLVSEIAVVWERVVETYDGVRPTQ
jgi:hypothetical protein